MDELKAQVRHLATLTKVTLTDEEVYTLAESFKETIEFMKNLKSLDTEGISESPQPIPTTNVTFEDGTKSDRTFSQEEALHNAGDTKRGYIIVNKILDK